MGGSVSVDDPKAFSKSRCGHGRGRPVQIACGRLVTAVGAADRWPLFLCGLAVACWSGPLGCADSYGSKRLLARAVDDFNAQARWGRQEQAAAYLVPTIRKEYLDRVERLGQKVHITGFEILRVIWRKGGKEVLVRLRFKWQRSDEIVLRQTIIVETWRKSGKGWILVRIRQLTKPLLPLFPPGPRPLAE